MNKIIDCLSTSQVELLKCHIDYLIENKYVQREPIEGDAFSDTCQMYADPPFENVLHYLKPKVEEAYGKELVPTYSFWRRYFKGQDCPPHKDRPSCQVSITLNLGGDGGSDWAIYVEDKKFELEIGQAVIYKGCEQEHWRHELPYKSHSQVFIHYIEKDGKYYPEYQFDKRPNLYYTQN
jgi:hypothetical protein